MASASTGSRRVGASKVGRASRWLAGVAAIGGLALAGCQTYPAGFGGMTLPSPHYLKHYPQYLPPDPPFPLQRELDSMQGPEVLRPGAPGVVPPPLPPLPDVRPPAPQGGVPPAGIPAPAPAPAPGAVPPGM